MWKEAVVVSFEFLTQNFVQQQTASKKLHKNIRTTYFNITSNSESRARVLNWSLPLVFNRFMYTFTTSILVRRKKESIYDS